MPSQVLLVVVSPQHEVSAASASTTNAFNDPVLSQAPGASSFAQTADKTACAQSATVLRCLGLFEIASTSPTACAKTVYSPSGWVAQSVTASHALQAQVWYTAGGWPLVSLVRNRNSDMVQERRCIYCLEYKPSVAFNWEHVIPQAFGRFGKDSPVLDCVCELCNVHLGWELEQSSSYSSIEGVHRFVAGL